MITNTFCHMPHVGKKREERLWSSGIHTWDALATVATSGIFKSGGAEVAHAAEMSGEHLGKGDALYFSKRLPNEEHWRLFHEFRDTTAYFDIETRGVAPPHDAVTTIALYDGRRIRHYINGQNLDRFPEDIAEYRLLVTFNGSVFDVPYVEKFFGIRLPQAQIDLRFVLQRLGYTGGLKGCERMLGMDRGELDGVNGYLAVVLWREFIQQRNTRALETLLAYNIADTVNLERLMVVAYNENVRKTPFAEARILPTPVAPDQPFTADLETVRRLKKRYARFLR